MISTTVSNKIKNLILFIAGVLIIAIIITVIGIAKNNEIVFPNAISILESFFSLLGKGSTYQFIGVTLLDFIIALLISVILGMGLGTLAGFNDFLRGILKPFMVVFRSVPMIVLIVIIMLTLPDNNYRYVPSLCTAIVIIPILYEAVSEGIRRIEPKYTDVYKMNSNTNLKVVMNVHYPLIAGYIKQAFANAIGMGIKVAVTTEYIAGARYTLGQAIFNSKAEVEYTEIYAYALILIIIVALFELIPDLIIYIIKRIKAQKQKKRVSV